MQWANRLRERVWAKQAPKARAVLAAVGRMPIVPTKFGWAFNALLLVMFLWTVNHQLNLGYALLFICFTMAVLSAVLTVGCLARLEVSFREPAPVFAGEAAALPLVLKENSGRARPLLLIANRSHQTVCRGIAAGETAEVMLAQDMLKRGIHPAAPLEIAAVLPFNLYFAWQWITLQADIVVYPAPVGTQPMPASPADDGKGMLAAGQGDDELSGLSPYQSGDPLSRVAWKQAGRGELSVKRFAGEGAEKVCLDYTLAQGGHEARLSQLARWIVDAEAAGIYYSLKINGSETAYHRGAAHYHECLKILAVQP